MAGSIAFGTLTANGLIMSGTPPITNCGRRGIEDESSLHRVSVQKDTFIRLLARSDVEKLEVTQRCNGYVTYLRFYLDLASYPDRFFECIPHGDEWLLADMIKQGPHQDRPGHYDGKYTHAGSDWKMTDIAVGTLHAHTTSHRMFRTTLAIPGRWIWRQVVDPEPIEDPHGMCADHWHDKVPASVPCYAKTNKVCANPIWLCGDDCYTYPRHICT